MSGSRLRPDWNLRAKWLIPALTLALLCSTGQGALAQGVPTTAPRLTLFGASGPAAPALRHLDASLRDLAARAAGSATPGLAQLRLANPALRLRVASPLSTPEVLVDAVADADAAPLAHRLRDLGLRETAVFSNTVGGWLPVSALAAAGALPELRLARASMPRTRATGPVALQGDFVQNSAALRAANPSLTGKGVTVGVVSDSFNCYAYYAANGPPAQSANGVYGYATNGFTATYSDDQASGALPAGITVVKDATCADYGAPQQQPFSDEGRAMLQIVHVVAPGASLAYRTGTNSEADFANGIVQLQQLGAKVIADDIGYPDEPFFQDGVIAQAIDQVAAAGVTYFSAAGNDGRNAWGSSSPVFAANAATGATELDFAAGGGTYALPVTIPAVPPGDYVELVLEWDQPYVSGAPGSPGSSNALNLCIDSVSGAAPTDQVYGSLTAGGSDSNQFESVSYPACTGPNSVGADPVQILLIGNPANATASTQQQTINLSVRLASGSAPGRVKLLVGDNGQGAVISPSLANQSPTIQGHPMATGAVAMAAAFFLQTPACGTSIPQLESFSSWGGDPILFDTSGNRLATAQERAKPDLTGPDGVNDTMLGFVWSGSSQTAAVASCQSSPDYPNFFGTSAATPHAAGVAALLWQSRPGATTSQVISALKSGVVAMGTSQAGGSGAGFIDATAALAAMPAATSGSSSTTTSPHGGGGAFDWPWLAALAASLLLRFRWTGPCSVPSSGRCTAGPHSHRPSPAP